MKLMGEELKWLISWVRCYECPDPDECSDEEPCHYCKMQMIVDKKLRKAAGWQSK